MTVIKILPQPPDPLGGLKGQIFKLAIELSKTSIFFTEISHADRDTVNMKHIKRDFRSKSCVLPPGWT